MSNGNNNSNNCSKKDYYNRAKTEIRTYNELSEEQKKKIEDLEKKISIAEDTMKKALADVNKDLKNKEIEEYEAVKYRGEIQAEFMRETKNHEAKIREIDPGWTSTAREAIRMAMENLATNTEEGAGKLGLTVGEVMATPVSAMNEFWSNLKKSGSKRLRK